MNGKEGSRATRSWTHIYSVAFVDLLVVGYIFLRFYFPWSGLSVISSYFLLLTILIPLHIVRWQVKYSYSKWG